MIAADFLTALCIAIYSYSAESSITSVLVLAWPNPFLRSVRRVDESRDYCRGSEGRSRG